MFYMRQKLFERKLLIGMETSSEKKNELKMLIRKTSKGFAQP